MSMDVFLTLGIIAIVVITGWGMDRQLRKRDKLDHWTDRSGIQPMSDQDWRDNEELAKRREGK